MNEKIIENIEVPEEKRKELAEYIVKLKDERKLGFNQLALKSNLNVRSLTDILNGTIRRINPFQLKNLAVALKVNYLNLYKIVGYIDEEDIGANDKLTIVELKQDIPVYSRVFAGPDGMIDFGEIIEYITIPSLRNGTEVVGIKVDGDSMEHTIPDGAIILVKKDVEVNDREVGVFVHNNIPYVKRLRKDKNQMFLMSDNNAYLPIIVNESDDFIVVGKVVNVMWQL